MENIVVFRLLFIICVSAIITKQVLKINKNYSQKKLWPNVYTLRDKINSYDKIIVNDNFHYYHAHDGDNLCMYSASPCTSYKITDKINAKKRFNYIIISLKND